MSYPQARKIALAKEYEQGKSVADIAASSGIPRNSIYRWIREYKTIKTGTGEFTPNGFNKLQMHSTKNDHILEVIRLSGCISTVPQKKRLAILETIYNSHAEYSVHEICEALEVNRATFYNHIFRRSDTSWRDEKAHQLMLTVQQIFDDSGQRYGANKIMKAMNAQGIAINKQKVLDIMHELGIEAMGEGAKKSYKQKREQYTNRVRREFSVNKPNRVWVSDITHYKCIDRSMFICVVIDLYSRMVVGYSVSDKESKQIVSSALKKAVEFRNPEPGLIFHSDRGGQYLSNSFIKLLGKYGMIQSLSAKGRPYDNAVSEAFFSIMKKEELYRNNYRSIYEFKSAVNSYIDFYNHIRVHSYLGYLSPEQFEIKMASKNDNGPSK